MAKFCLKCGKEVNPEDLVCVNCGCNIQPASTKVVFKNIKTGEIKKIELGFSWGLLFFSGFFGIPLFIRRLHIWGTVFMALYTIQLILSCITMETFDEIATSLIFGMTIMGLAVFMGVKGNEMTAKNYLENGWVFAEPNSDISRRAKSKWGIV